ncbi:MAG: aminoacyl-tRNA hydrolase [Clostridiales bacterium]|nr:aminoacyl-tRNA hydrolase [Clostridiales bacterium]
MFVIAGLGNPGKKYERTRHNMGFLTIDYIAEKNGIKVNKIKHKALVGDGIISDQKVILVKPQTYMNLSGESLRQVVNYYGIEPQELIVVYDDLDLETGALRVRKKGSAGSHNGMKSVIYQLQTEEFPRIRIGIGKSGGLDWKEFVTGRIGKGDKKSLEDAVCKAANAALSIITDGIDKAMNEYNTRTTSRREDDSEQQGND